MKILVTGAAGFLGSWVADSLHDLGHEVVGLDNLVGGSEENVSRTYRKADILCPKEVIAACGGCDTVYHCAALAYEGLSVFSPRMIVDNIVTGTVNVAVCAINAGVKRFVNCSSMARYGNAQPPFIEDHTAAIPEDPYGLAKLCAEDQLNLLGRVHGMQVVHAVPHNIYGPRQKYDDPFRNVAAIFANQMLRGVTPKIYGDGEQVRCFSYIGDVLPAMLRLLDCACDVPMPNGVRVGHGEVFNVGPDRGWVTINRLFKVVADAVGFKERPEYVDSRPCEVKRAYCSSQKIRERFGVEPNRTSLEDGIAILVEDIRRRGPKRFTYHLPIEIDSPKVPRTWRERLM